MALVVVPTLAVMAELYRLDTTGGPASPRFRAYEELGRSGAPVSGYNPMTSKPVLATIEALLAIDAEAIVRDAAQAAADELGHDGELLLYLTVATPGMWTDRLATEVDHRLGGRFPGQVLLWTGEDVTPGAVERAARAQAVRAVRRAEPRTTVADVTRTEGLALAVAGDDGVLDATAAEVLAVLADDDTTSSKVAFLWGDAAATALGYTPIGLGPEVGLRHVTALARQRPAHHP